jgi:hypothetical protein
MHAITPYAETALQSVTAVETNTAEAQIAPLKPPLSVDGTSGVVSRRELARARKRAAGMCAAVTERGRVTLDRDYPSMPTGPPNFEHREKQGAVVRPFLLVARPVYKPERMTNPAAHAALEKKWTKLNNTVRADGGVGCWDVKTVREARDVVLEAKQKGE